MIAMGLSIAQRLAKLPASQREAFVRTLPEHVLAEMNRGEWWYVARPEQIPPQGTELVYLYMAGRGAGKSRAGSEWIVERVLRHPFDRHGVPTEWLVVADTLADARTINAEGPSGILNVLTRRKVDHRYKQSPRPMILFPDGAKIYLEGADDQDTGRGYNSAGVLCVARGEPVATDRGPVPIEDVSPLDQVWTSLGWRRVLASRLTGLATSVVTVMTTVGTVRLTRDHLVKTRHGWTPAGLLVPGDSLLTCLPKMEQRSLGHPRSRRTTSGTGSTGTTTSGHGTTTTGTGSSFIGRSGSRNMDPSPRGTRSITATGAAGTITWRTWNFSPSRNTDACPPWSETILPGYDSRNLGWSVPDSWPTGSDAGLSHPRSSSAMCVEPRSRAEACAPSDVPSAVEPNTIVGMQETTVIDVQPDGVSDVFDLLVEDAHSFCAGHGFIEVHNCDEMAKWIKPFETWYEGLLPSLRADLIDDHPRAFVTTTPKPIRLLVEWLARDDGTVHVITGSTFDNATNLSAHALRELKLRYHGTALGEQELYGKLLELTTGGLFKRMDIVKHRVLVPPDPAEVVATVVGVDPNLTGDEALTGIVVLCRTKDNEQYVLGDRSIPDSGRAAALAIWRTVAEFTADLVVYEENLGKRYLQEVLQDAYQECVELGMFPRGTSPPMRPVHARHGKKTRAEPVAMRCEQGRLHVVGELPELEDQMVLFDPQSTRESPDRMDAMVHASINLMAGERKQMRVSDPAKYDFRLTQDLYDLGRLM